MVQISNTKIFDCSVDGIKLETSDLVQLHQYYCACCTAEFIMENGYGIDDEEEALKIGYSVRELMDDAEISEIDAIDEILKDRGLDKDDI